VARPVKHDLHLTSVAEHERAAAECADPIMRDLWLATAAEWRQVSKAQAKAQPRRTKKAARTRPAGVWSDFLVLAQQKGADAILDFRQGNQIELVDGLCLVAWPAAAAAVFVTAEHADADATAIAGLLNPEPADLIV
jgi:hypothetical protein